MESFHLMMICWMTGADWDAPRTRATASERMHSWLLLWMLSLGWRIRLFFLVFVSWNYISNHDDWNQWIIYFSTTLVTSLSTIILKTQQVLPNKHSFPRWRMRSLTKWPENRPRDISHLSFRGWVKTLAKWSNELPQLNAGDAVRWWLQPVSCVPALVGSW